MSARDLFLQRYRSKIAFRPGKAFFCPNLLLMKLKGDEKGQAGSRGVENTLVDRNIFHLKRRADT